MDERHGREPPDPAKVMTLLTAFLRSERAASDYSEEQSRIYRGICRKLGSLQQKEKDTGSN